MKYNILIVEDNTGIAELIEEKLIAAGYQVILAHSGHEAIRYIIKDKPKIVVLDFSLPDMDGVEIVNSIHEKNVEMPPFIVSTGRGDEKLAVDFMKLGAYDYLVKDQSLINRLPETIKKLIHDIEREEALKQAEKRLAKAVFETEEQERRNLAVQLHENIAPVISTIKMYIARLKRMEGIEKKEKSIVDYSDELIDNAVNKIRDLSNELMPSVLFDFGLEKAIHSLSRKTEREHEVNIRLQLPEHKMKISDNASVMLFRVVNSLLKGSVFHSSATIIMINISMSSEKIFLHYSDNGQKNVSNKKDNAEKLKVERKKMFDRIESFQGSFILTQKEPNGIAVDVELPENI